MTFEQPVQAYLTRRVVMPGLSDNTNDKLDKLARDNVRLRKISQVSKKSQAVQPSRHHASKRRTGSVEKLESREKGRFRKGEKSAEGSMGQRDRILVVVHHPVGWVGECLEVRIGNKFLCKKTLFSGRFPFTALENGGGTFVIPYTIIVFLVGKPLYYMELLLGQFSSRGCIKVYDMSPAARGVGFGQCLCTIAVLTVYASVMGLTIRYFLASFSNPLPWSVCQDAWNVSCIDSSIKVSNFSNATGKSSAELYFT